MSTRYVRGQVIKSRHDPLDRGLIGEWRFDHDAGNVLPDFSGYKNHGTIVPRIVAGTNYTSFSPTAVGLALEVTAEAGNQQNNNDSYVNCGTLHRQPVSAITMEGFCYQALPNQARDSRLMSCNDGAGGAGSHHYMLSTINVAPNETWRARVHAGGATRTFLANNTEHDLFRWEHVVFTYDGSNYAFWVNG
ncbi:MAG: LamG-like jellyroll fold domain-containing protein, partial [Planctomycetota bacterium]